MCKGKSFVLTKNEIYESILSNSHETIKKEHNIRDTILTDLCVIELYPRGKYICSQKRADWELNCETKPQWFLENFTINRDMHVERLIDNPMNNIVKAIGKESPSKQSLLTDSLLDF